MNKEIIKLKTIAEIAKSDFMLDVITLEQAKEKIMPYIDVTNIKSKEIAKKYKQRYRGISFTGFMR